MASDRRDRPNQCSEDHLSSKHPEHAEEPMKILIVIFAALALVGCSGPGVTSSGIKNDTAIPSNTEWWQLNEACTDPEQKERNRDFCPPEAYENE